MTLLCWLLTMSGLVLCAWGAYLWGHHRQQRDLKRLHEAIDAAKSRIKALDEELKYRSLQDELTVLTGPPESIRSASGALEVEDRGAIAEPTEPPPPSTPAQTPPPPTATAVSEDPSADATRIVEVDVDAAMKKAAQDEQRARQASGRMGGESAPGPDRPNGSDMTRRISLESAEEMLSLSQQVDLLTDDLGRVHKQLAESRGRVGELEGEAGKRRKRIAALQDLVEKQKQELKRRDKRIRHLLSEVGVTFKENHAVDETIEALESLDVTKKTRRVELADLYEIGQVELEKTDPDTAPFRQKKDLIALEQTPVGRDHGGSPPPRPPVVPKSSKTLPDGPKKDHRLHAPPPVKRAPAGAKKKDDG